MSDILDKLKKMLSSQFGEGISWNMVSLVIMAISGILYNIIIGAKYGKEAIGLFNGTMAYYATIAQLSVCGIHFSTLKYTSEFHEDNDKLAEIIGSSLVSTAVVSLLISIFAYFVLKAVRIFVDHELVGNIFYVLPALFFFAINKVILNYFNGLSRMKEYAVFQSLRYVFIIITIIILVLLNVPDKVLVFCFMVSEVLLSICMTIYVIKVDYIKFRFDKAWFREHLRYGFKIMPGNLVLELNGRMDIIILGWLTNSGVVGIYSFGLRFAEGFYQMLVVVRRNINPQIARYIVKQDVSGFNKFKNDLIKHTKYLVPAFAAIITMGYTIISYLFGGEGKEYINALLPMIIVITSITINSKYIIFGNILNQTGFPASESRLNIATLLTNIALNIILIPKMGMYGAAIGTAISYCVFSFILNYGIKKNVYWKSCESSKNISF